MMVVIINKMANYGNPRYDVVKNIKSISIDYGFEQNKTGKIFTAVKLISSNSCYYLYDIENPKALFEALKESLKKGVREVKLPISIFDFEKPIHTQGPTGYTLERYLAEIELAKLIDKQAFKMFRPIEKEQILRGVYRPIRIRADFQMVEQWRRMMPLPEGMLKTKKSFFHEIFATPPNF